MAGIEIEPSARSICHSIEPVDRLTAKTWSRFTAIARSPAITAPDVPRPVPVPGAVALHDCRNGAWTDAAASPP
jgi:hypothetical protein